MTVIKVESFSRGKNRYCVYLDNGFSFVLYKGELSQYGITEGVELSDEEYEDILKSIIIPRAKKRAMNLLQKMDRTESDVRNKLSESGYPIEAVDEAVAYLESFHYLDDRRYADEYVRFKKESMSRKQIKMKLMEKGIKKEIIDASLTEGFDENDNTEIALIEKLILKKSKGQPEEMEYSQKQKLFAYLYGKGFAVSDIETAYKHLT